MNSGLATGVLTFTAGLSSVAGAAGWSSVMIFRSAKKKISFDSPEIISVFTVKLSLTFSQSRTNIGFASSLVDKNQQEARTTLISHFLLFLSSACAVCGDWSFTVCMNCAYRCLTLTIHISSLGSIHLTLQNNRTEERNRWLGHVMHRCQNIDLIVKRSSRETIIGDVRLRRHALWGYSGMSTDRIYFQCVQRLS